MIWFFLDSGSFRGSILAVYFIQTNYFIYLNETEKKTKYSSVEFLYC